MTDNNVIPIREPRAKCLRKALDAWHTATAQWIEQTLELAVELRAARDECGSNHRFGVWLAENDCDDLGKDARAALINMGEHRELSRDVLRLTDRKSIELIWEREIKPIVERRSSSERSEHDTKRIDSAKSPESIPSTGESSDSPSPKTDTEGAKVQLGRQSRLRGRNRADEVAAIFLQKDTRVALGLLPDVAWKLVLRAIDGELLPKPTDSATKKPTMRLIFPYGSGAYCNNYDLTNAKDRAFIASILPTMIELKDRLLAEPDRLQEILEQYRREHERQAHAAVIEHRTQKAVAALPPGETEVIMFGKRMWPLVLGETVGTYDFKTLQVAVWKFTDLNRNLWLGEKNPVGRAIMIRNSTKWDRHFIGEMTKGTEVAAKIDRVYSLVHALCSLMEQNPDGECREPMTPLVLG